MRLRDHLQRNYAWAAPHLHELFLPADAVARFGAADQGLVEAMHELLRTEIVRQLDARRAEASARCSDFLRRAAAGAGNAGVQRTPPPIRSHTPTEHDVARARGLALYRRDDELAELAGLFLGYAALAAHADPEIVRPVDPVGQLWQGLSALPG